MGDFITIYGEVITGHIVSVLENTVIVEDTRNVRHVVHKDSITSNHVRAHFTFAQDRFDLEQCQTIGNSSTVVRKGRRI